MPTASRSRRRISAGVFLLALHAAGFSTAGAASVDVHATVGNTFMPHDVSILVGDQVRWIRDGNGFHNMNADDGTFTCAADCAANGDPSNTWTNVSFTFVEPDLELYHCEVHGFPGGGGMSGTVNVRRAIFADGFEGGDELEWAALSPTGDSCSSAILVSLSNVGVPGTLQGSSNDFDLPLGAGCLTAGTHGRDKVYEVLVPANTTVQISVMPEFAAPNPEFDPVIYVQDHDDCGDTAETIACYGAANSAPAGQTETLQIGPDGAQRVFHVYVDSASASVAGSNYTITIESL